MFYIVDFKLLKSKNFFFPNNFMQNLQYIKQTIRKASLGR